MNVLFKLRSLGVGALATKLISIFFPNPGRFNPDADCIFWTLDMITDPEVTTAALRYLTSIKWHYNPSETVSLQQVARIYMKCFDSGYRLLTESRDMAYAAGWALIQLYAHRLCSNMDSVHTHQIVVEAFDHLSDEKTQWPASVFVVDRKELSGTWLGCYTGVGDNGF